MINFKAMKFINHILQEKITSNDAQEMYKKCFNKQSLEINLIDHVLESNLLNLTETDDDTKHPIANEHEDIKSNLLQELMIVQHNIRQLTKNLYDKDIAIQCLLNERKYLESNIYQNRDKVHQLTMNIMNLGSY